jgi:hypothetical protein
MEWNFLKKITGFIQIFLSSLDVWVWDLDQYGTSDLDWRLGDFCSLRHWSWILLKGKNEKYPINKVTVPGLRVDLRFEKGKLQRNYFAFIIIRYRLIEFMKLT